MKRVGAAISERKRVGGRVMEDEEEEEKGLSTAVGRSLRPCTSLRGEGKGQRSEIRVGAECLGSEQAAILTGWGMFSAGKLAN